MQERRSKGQRRWGLVNEFPLKNHEGNVVIAERRSIPDRRLANTKPEDRLTMLARILSGEVVR